MPYEFVIIYQLIQLSVLSHTRLNWEQHGRFSLPLALSFPNVLIQLVTNLFHIVDVNLSEANDFDSAVEFLNLFHFLNLLPGHGAVVLDQSLESPLNISNCFGSAGLVCLDLSEELRSQLLILGNQLLLCFFIVI